MLRLTLADERAREGCASSANFPWVRSRTAAVHPLNVIVRGAINVAMRSTVAGSSMTSGSPCSVRVRRAMLAATLSGLWSARRSSGPEARERADGQGTPGEEDTTQPPGPGCPCRPAGVPASCIIFVVGTRARG